MTIVLLSQCAFQPFDISSVASMRFSHHFPRSLQSLPDAKIFFQFLHKNPLNCLKSKDSRHITSPLLTIMRRSPRAVSSQVTSSYRTIMIDWCLRGAREHCRLPITHPLERLGQLVIDHSFSFAVLIIQCLWASV